MPEHRRIESRGIIGTGMATDPERLRDLERRAERFARDRNLPKRKFGDVISGASADLPEGTEVVNEQTPERQRKGVKPRPPPPPPRSPSRGATPPPPGPDASPTPDAADPDRTRAAPPPTAPANAAPSGPAGSPGDRPPPQASAEVTDPEAPAPAPPTQGTSRSVGRPPLGVASPAQSAARGQNTRVTFKV
jgi:hypothetical protein